MRKDDDGHWGIGGSGHGKCVYLWFVDNKVVYIGQGRPERAYSGRTIDGVKYRKDDPRVYVLVAHKCLSSRDAQFIEAMLQKAYFGVNDREKRGWSTLPRGHSPRHRFKRLFPQHMLDDPAEWGLIPRPSCPECGQTLPC